jgi:hypothetical protein
LPGRISSFAVDHFFNEILTVTLRTPSVQSGETKRAKKHSVHQRCTHQHRRPARPTANNELATQSVRTSDFGAACAKAGQRSAVDPVRHQHVAFEDEFELLRSIGAAVDHRHSTYLGCFRSADISSK